ncbi:MAG: type II toxin-antitoxin system death-on-curing family toxin [Bacteroidia bacterium]
MIVLNIELVLAIHRNLILESGGANGLRDQRILKSCVETPFMTFGGEDLYPTLIDKAASLGFSLIANHPFVDGNKRIGHAAMEIFLKLNGRVIDASVDEQEALILGIASGEINREIFTNWLRKHVIIFPS